MKNLERLIGEKIEQIFYFNNMLIVINFGEQIKYSLHTQCLVRISLNGQVLLTTSDIYFNPDFTRKTKKERKKESLLDVNLNNVKNVLKDAIVKSVQYSDIGDVIIYFDNDVKLELIVDCLCDGMEYYRFIQFHPHYLDSDEQCSEHYIMTFSDGKFIESIDN